MITPDHAVCTQPFSAVVLQFCAVSQRFSGINNFLSPALARDWLGVLSTFYKTTIPLLEQCRFYTLLTVQSSLE